MKVETTSNTAELTELMEKIARDFDLPSRVRAANRTRDRVTTATRRMLTSQFKIPAAAVSRKRIFKGRTATTRSPVASLKAGTWVVPVAKLGPVQKTKKAGVSYRTPSGKVTNPHAFVVATLGTNPFVRAGKARLPIKKISADLLGPVEQVLSVTASDSAVTTIFQREFESTMNYRVNQELKKWRMAN